MKTKRKYIQPTMTEKNLAIRNMILTGSPGDVSGTGSDGNEDYWARYRNSNSELGFISNQSSVEQINWDF